MRQENGADLLGPDDPRGATIGVIYVAPNDDRESVLAAILTQEKLGRKQIAIVLPGQNKAFQRPVDFDGLKNMRRKLQAQLIIVTPSGLGPAEFARQRQFPVFSSLESFTKSLQDNDQDAPNAKRGWEFWRRPQLPAVDDAGNKNEFPPSPPPIAMVPPMEPLSHEADLPQEQQDTSPLPDAAAMGAAGAAGSRAADLAMHTSPDEYDELPPLTHIEDGGDALSPPPPQAEESSLGSSAPVQDNQDTIEPPSTHAESDAGSGPGIIEFPQSRARTAGNVPVPEDQPEPPPVTPVPNRRNPDNMAVVGAAAVGAGAGSASRVVGTGSPPPTTGNARSGRPRRHRRAPWVLLLLGLIALLLLTPLLCIIVALTAPGALGPLGNIVPRVFGSPSATVTLTPKRTQLNTPFVIFGVTGTPAHADIRPQSQPQATATPTSTQPPRQMQTRVLSYTTPAQSKMVNATGVHDIPATQATGTLTFSNGQGAEFTVAAGTNFPISDGVVLVLDGPVTIPAGNPSSGYGRSSGSAHAANAGANGNVGAGAINTTCCDPSGAIFVYNSAFGGGQDPQHYTYVLQSDIDGAAIPLEAPLEQKALAAVQGQKKASEQFVAKPQCTHSVTANQTAGDQGVQVSSVTVTATATCRGEVYDPTVAQTLAADLLKNQAIKSLGADYVLVGGITSSVTKATVIDTKGTVSLVVSAQGMWVYQFSNMQKQQLAKLIAGKSKKDATTLLMQQPGVAQVKIDLANADAVPTDTSQITFVGQSAPGLAGTPTRTSSQPHPTPKP